MTVSNIPALPHPTKDNIDRTYMDQLVNSLEFALEQLNRGEPVKNNVIANPASGDYLQFDGQTWRNVRFPMGSFYISSPSLTTISVQNTWYKVAGTTTDVTVNDFDGKTALSVDNRLKYTGTISTHVHGVVSFASDTVGTNKVLEYGAYHYDDSAASGSILTHSVVQRTHGSVDIGTGAIHFDVTLDTNDYIEFHIRCTSTPTTNATIENAYLFIMGMG